MNELSMIFARLGTRTDEVLKAAGTTWNFHQLPARTGRRSTRIPVDPYYLVKKAKEVGHHPQVILAGRSINDSMPKYVAEMAVKGLNKVGKVIKGSNVLIMGLTYKEDVADIRESPIEKMVQELKEYDANVYGYGLLRDWAHCIKKGVISRLKLYYLQHYSVNLIFSRTQFRIAPAE